ncbi:MAG TPA: hypothetical protein VGD61_16775 [Pyrinomonadaceae bacterium]
MSTLLRRPSDGGQFEARGRFERFNLEENPFPSDPFVNKDSTDKRVNGEIYEVEIRRPEYEKIEENFLRHPQADLNHIRLGYLVDTSFVGRGNGKSAFLVNLQQNINKEYCLDISDGHNKCFALLVTPEAGGRTKTFPSFVDQMFDAILRLRIIDECLAILRLEAITKLYPRTDLTEDLKNEKSLRERLRSPEWFWERDFDLSAISETVASNEFLQAVPPTFPVLRGRPSLIKPFETEGDFANYYVQDLKKGKERYDFLFSHLVRFFQAAGFNGAYVLVDDFERIPDFQSARQKRDFALELRSCLFDGTFTNAKIGFYNMILVLHAGVQRLIEEAWALSGMENRAPISPRVDSSHVIAFEKLSENHASLLLKKYLSEYRIAPVGSDPLSPFTNDAVRLIGEMSEYNASKILKTAYELLEKAASLENQAIIDRDFVLANKGGIEITTEIARDNKETEPEDLMKKARKAED